MCEYTTGSLGKMQNCDEGEFRIDEALRGHDGKSVLMLEVGGSALHFILRNPHFVANGFAFARLRRTMM